MNEGITPPPRHNATQQKQQTAPHSNRPTQQLSSDAVLFHDTTERETFSTCPTVRCRSLYLFSTTTESIAYDWLFLRSSQGRSHNKHQNHNSTNSPPTTPQLFLVQAATLLLLWRGRIFEIPYC